MTFVSAIGPRNSDGLFQSPGHGALKACFSGESRARFVSAANVEIVGEKSFKEKELLTQLKDQLTSISELGLTAARADEKTK